MGGASLSSTGSADVLNIELGGSIVVALEKQAKAEKKSTSALVRRAIEKYLEDAEDYRDAMKVLKKKNKAIPFSEVKKRLGLGR